MRSLVEMPSGLPTVSLVMHRSQLLVSYSDILVSYSDKISPCEWGGLVCVTYMHAKTENPWPPLACQMYESGSRGERDGHRDCRNFDTHASLFWCNNAVPRVIEKQ